MLAELTHRCPLQCPYCYNPVALERPERELSTDEWRDTFDQAAALGVLQLHISGGEPMARPDLFALAAHAAGRGLYLNLITSGVLIDRDKAHALADAGIDHVQLSFQDTDPEMADRLSGYRDSYARKREAAVCVRDAGLPLTINAVMHRGNMERLESMIELATEFGAGRLEVANVQYYGWGLRNRAALIPTRAQINQATEIVETARKRLSGKLVIDYVVPDYYARRPKACMGGWGQRFLNITPSGDVLPCHAAQTLPNLSFDNVREIPLADIWRDSIAFNLYRGTNWMAEPCASCNRKEVDWGGCRCQALALTGDAGNTDPACALSPDHARMVGLATDESAHPAPDFEYRRMPPA